MTPSAETGSSSEPAPRSNAFFGAFPALGIWTPLGLSRFQFFAVLVGSIAMFTLLGGPAWRHLHDPHLVRISVSYAAIPLGVGAAYAYNRDRRLTLALAAAAVIALIKLVATALLLMLFSIAAS